MYVSARAHNSVQNYKKKMIYANINRKFKEQEQKKTSEDVFCVPREARTLDPLIKSQLLYQLS